MNDSVFGKTMEKVRNHSYIKLVTTDEKRIKLVSEPNCHKTKRFSENLLAIEMKKKKKNVKMNKPIRKTLMNEFLYDYLNEIMEIEHNYVTWILIDLLFLL